MPSVPSGVRMSDVEALSRVVLKKCGPAYERATSTNVRQRLLSAYTYVWFTPTRAQVDAVRADLRAFREREALDGLVLVNLASTERWPDPSATCLQTPEAFEAGLDADVLEDLVCPFVRDGLRLAERRDLGRVLVAVGNLVEIDPVGEDLVIGLNIGIDLLVRAEVGLGAEDDRDEGKLRVDRRNLALAKGLGEALVQVFEQPEARLGELG